MEDQTVTLKSVLREDADLFNDFSTHYVSLQHSLRQAKRDSNSDAKPVAFNLGHEYPRGYAKKY
jgi:hypothetical protein